ncbi:MAG: DUF4142 domain-containing protein [Betaproteobacteria bacterium]
MKIKSPLAIAALSLLSAVYMFATLVAITVMSGNPLPAFAQENTAAPKDPPHSQNAAPLDKKFVMEASQAGNAEVDAGNMALRKASSAEVKAFAQKMVDDHSKAGNDLTSAANKAGLTPSKDTPPAYKSVASNLAALNGKAFDKAYVNQQLDEHRKAVALFKEESAKGGNLDLKEFATRTLPTLEMHLKHVEGVKSAKGF